MKKIKSNGKGYSESFSDVDMNYASRFSNNKPFKKAIKSVVLRHVIHTGNDNNSLMFRVGAGKTSASYNNQGLDLRFEKNNRGNSVSISKIWRWK
tara:strand:- start:342 stop:626 length:285 start_codon:yes stop_codon:yes gene_type:complete